MLCCRATKPGVKESELAGIYKGEVAKAGGQVYWMHMAVSRGGNFPAIKDKVLQKGRYLSRRHGLLHQRLSRGCLQIRLRRGRANG